MEPHRTAFEREDPQARIVTRFPDRQRGVLVALRAFARGTAVAYVRIIIRGFLLVTLVSSNTVWLARGDLGFAAAGGFMISSLWWSNSSSTRENVPGAAYAYGFGAGLGTLTGAWIAHWIRS